jgi:uncharacterized membrane protein YgcG
MRLPFAAPLALLAPLSALTLGVACALPARAEEGAENDLERKLKEQIQKVLKLMKENEDALLQASTQGGKAPQGPQVPVPPPGSQGQGGAGGASGGGGPEGGGTAGGTGSDGAGPGAAGEGARASLDELLKALREGGGAIPGEIENLIKMMPT